jgi:AraC-like DNA-binding protein/ligand-binding sensor protein
MTGNPDLVQTLAASVLYREYERAFSETTGLPVSLRPVQAWNLPHHGKKYENPFCRMMAGKSSSCASCLRVQEKLGQSSTDAAQTIVCDAGLSDTAVPVKVGDELVGYLQTGQVFRKAPTAEQFSRFARQLQGWGIEASAVLKDAYFSTRVVAPGPYAQMVKLLSLFAQHLAILSNQLIVRRQNAEPPMVSRAKTFIEEHQTDDLSLSDVSRAVHSSSFHFCKVFKKATGLTFTNYLSRLRVEKAKNLLLNPNLRISEIAYEIGFQSLTHFNRVFKKVAGESPTIYRARAGTAR